jgi:hypothetical protein
MRFDHSALKILSGMLNIMENEGLLIRFEDKSIWNRYPIQVLDVSFILNNTASQSASGAIDTLNKARLPVSIVMTFMAPAAASFLDMLMNTLFLLKLLEGPGVGYPDNILALDMGTNLIPVQIDNPFASWIEAGPICEPTDAFVRHDIRCNILANKGVSLIEIGGLLMAAVCVVWVTRFGVGKIREMEGRKREKEKGVRWRLKIMIVLKKHLKASLNKI